MSGISKIIASKELRIGSKDFVVEVRENPSSSRFLRMSRTTNTHADEFLIDLADMARVGKLINEVLCAAEAIEL